MLNSLSNTTSVILFKTTLVMMSGSAVSSFLIDLALLVTETGSFEGHPSLQFLIVFNASRIEYLSPASSLGFVIEYSSFRRAETVHRELHVCI